MKVVILAGGRGTRISEESVFKPKPMIEIGGRPILWHIMKWYSYYGYNDFIVCCGYKGHLIKKYFTNYYFNSNDCSFSDEDTCFYGGNEKVEPWKVTLINTGLDTKTAGRLLLVREYIDNDESFMLTYGDGVSNVNINSLIQFHKQSNTIATITTTQPFGRFGSLKIFDDKVTSFKEKARADSAWINAGFMVFEHNIFDYLGDGSEMLEETPFEKLASDGEMSAYKHYGFWSPMDTIRDRAFLEKEWANGTAPWAVYNKLNSI